MSGSLDFETIIDLAFAWRVHAWPAFPEAIHEADWMTKAVLNHDVINPIPPPALRLECIA